MTGLGGNIIIVDDPQNASEAMSDTSRRKVWDWFTGTLLSRLDNKKEDVIIVVAQRLHDDDLVGRLLRTGEKWHHINLPAIAEDDQFFTLQSGKIVGRHEGEALLPQLEPLSVLNSLKASLGDPIFAAQYQQNPIPETGGLINWSWLGTFDLPFERQDGDLVTISWDTASKDTEVSDYSVGTVWLKRGNDHYLIDLYRARLNYPDLNKLIKSSALKHNADAVLIEDKASGEALIQDLQDEGEVRPIAIMPKGNKVTRMHTQTSMMAAGYVWVPRQASWLPDLKRELLQFPHSTYDDQMDSISQYLGWDGHIMEDLSGIRMGEPLVGSRGW
ncbi:MAG: phage terminase large subunit [Alphaproteobacteria bacterium]|nr:phage terminase large subunit [Alphaproteobacteria bacterium]